MLPEAVSQTSSRDSAICYVLPVLWIKSLFHIMEPMGQNQRRRYVSSSLLGGDTGGEVCYSRLRCLKVTLQYNTTYPSNRCMLLCGYHAFFQGVA